MRKLYVKAKPDFEELGSVDPNGLRKYAIMEKDTI